MDLNGKGSSGLHEDCLVSFIYFFRAMICFLVSSCFSFLVCLFSCLCIAIVVKRWRTTPSVSVGSPGLSNTSSTCCLALHTSPHAMSCCYYWLCPCKVSYSFFKDLVKVTQENSTNNQIADVLVEDLLQPRLDLVTVS